MILFSVRRKATAGSVFLKRDRCRFEQSRTVARSQVLPAILGRCVRRGADSIRVPRVVWTGCAKFFQRPLAESSRGRFCPPQVVGRAGTKGVVS
jgi:hypothetical protein